MKSWWHRLGWLVLPAALLAGCSLFAPRPTAPPPPAPRVHPVLEPAYQGDGAWFYPHESYSLDQTGLATIYPANGAPQTTTDGEAYDPAALTAAHQTLQLPAIVQVTNLENGRQILVRVNDRGPPTPQRLIELTPRAATLLGIAGTGRVRVVVQAGPSQALTAALGGGAPKLDLNAAPRAGVQAETLPPPGSTAPAGLRTMLGVDRGQDAAAAPPPPLRLPETVTQTVPHPGQLWIRGGEFGRADYANRQRAALGGMGQVERIREGRQTTYRVKAGPFPTVQAADAALDAALREGVTDAHIVVE